MFNPGGQPKFSPETKDSVENETAEFRQEMSRKLTRFLSIATNIEALGGRTAEEVFADPESTKQFLSELNPDDYNKLLEGLNGILRGKDRSTWSADGHDVTIGSWSFPIQSDKIELLCDSLNAAKQMIENGRDITDIAYLLSTTITACHLFENGNGRTSRAIFLLTNKGFRTESHADFKELMSSDGELSRLTNPNLFYGLIKTKMCCEIGVDWENLRAGDLPITQVTKSEVMDYVDHLSETNREHFLALFDGPIFYTAIALLQFNTALLDQYRHNVTREINIIELIKQLSNENIGQFFSIVDSVKKQYVSAMIDCFIEPEKPENRYKVTSQDGTVSELTIVDLLKRARISEELKGKIY